MLHAKRTTEAYSELLNTLKGCYPDLDERSNFTLCIENHDLVRELSEGSTMGQRLQAEENAENTTQGPSPDSQAGRSQAFGRQRTRQDPNRHLRRGPVYGSDQEKGLVKAIKLAFKDCIILFCVSHIKSECLALCMAYSSFIYPIPQTSTFRELLPPCRPVFHSPQNLTQSLEGRYW